jgi:hypothetical protein
MADSHHLNDSARRRAQIIAEQALRESAAAPANWRAKRKRRSFTTWNTPAPTTSQPQAQPATSADDSGDAPAVKE